MKKPLLQVALDNTSLADAMGTLSGGLGEVVDIVEVGTVLILCEGVRAIQAVRSLYPDKVVTADFKLCSRTFAPKILEQEPNITTVFSGAPYDEMCEIYKQAKERGKNQIVQIELHGEWTFEQAEKWRESGIDHIIYGRPRHVKGPWKKESAAEIQRLIDMGYNVTVTGGVTYEDLDVFAGLPIYAIICGSSVRKAPSPVEEAKRIQARLTELWADK